MAKTPKPKTSKKAPSLHSRLSRRATSPSLNLDKSLTTLPRPHDKPTIRSAGVSKRKTKPVLKRRQRLRIERGKERAEMVGGRVERKRERRRGGAGRNADWDEVNGRIGGKKGKRGGKGGDEEGLGDKDVAVDADGDRGKDLGNEISVQRDVCERDGNKALDEEL